jgi:ubiquinol-cytochrome c reductase cytochrome b subunit
VSIQTLLDAIDDRTGYRKLLRGVSDAPVTGGPSWGFVLGTTTLVLFLVLLATGVALSVFYSPSSTDAWASIVYIEREIPLGQLLRALHLHAHSAFVIVMALHLLRVIVWGAYRAPREATWLSGVLLFAVVPAFSLTGYLLPYDQNAYWATKVRMGIVGSAPVVGELQTRLLLGGNDIGNLSLTRFFALHTMVLPLVFFVLLGAHLYFFRRHGPTPRPSLTEAEARRSTVAYWPSQAAFDALAALFVLLALFAVSIRIPAHLDAPADPAASYLARPEWYFLFLFQLLKYLGGPLELLGKVGVPAVGMLFLCALPFLDRAPTRALRERKGILGLVAGALLVISILTGLAIRADARDPEMASQKELAHRESTRARQLAAAGVPVEGATFMAGRDPLIRGERVYRAECASCHVLGDLRPKEPSGPELTGYRSKAWLRQVLRDPDSHRMFGLSKVYGMDSYATVPDADLAKLVDYLYALRLPEPPTAEAAGVVELLDTHECGKCHDFEDDYGLEGPALFRYGSQSWVRAVVADPGADHLYGKANTMPKFGERLSASDVDAVTAFLLTLEERGGDPAKWPYVDEPAPTPRKVPTSSTATTTPEAPAPEAPALDSE